MCGTDHGRTTVGRDTLALDGSSIVDSQVAGNSPFRATDRVGGLVELGSHVQIEDLGLTTVDGIETDEGVDFEVSEVEVDVDGVEADEEVDEVIFLLGGDVREEGGGDDFAGGERLSDVDVEFEGFGVNITNVDTSFVGEKDGIAFTLGVDADVVLGVGGVREERLENEVVQGSRDGFNLGEKIGADYV